ncbi:mariner Mos1 transposase [Trichonephila clavipes]|nr:mariner Mos1 transposase [Trichonephila clavipes]
MIDSSSYVNPTPLAHADTSRDVIPRGVTSQGVVFHHDNTKPHTSLVTRQKLLELGWDVLPHSPYSPDLAPSDYFLFRSLRNSLNGKSFNNDDDVKSYLIQFFANKNQKFYERGIMMLPERWQKVIDQNGQYITE